jgi:hypothetical protein
VKPTSALRWSLGVLVCLLVAEVRAADDPAAADVRWRLEAGRSLRYRITQDLRLVQGIVAANQAFNETTTRQVLTVRFDVLEASPEETRLRGTIERVEVTTDLPDVKHPSFPHGPRLRWTSDQDPSEDDVLDARLARLLVGREFELRASPAGEVRTVSGFDRPLEEARSLVLADGSYGFEVRIAMLALLNQTMGDRAMAHDFNSVFVPLPGGPRAVGTRWQRASSEALGGIATLRTVETFTIREVQGPHLRFDARMRLQLLPPEDGGADTFAGIPLGAEANEMMARIYARVRSRVLRADYAFSGEFDGADGSLARSSARQELQLQLEFPDEPLLRAMAGQTQDLRMRVRFQAERIEPPLDR